MEIRTKRLIMFLIYFTQAGIPPSEILRIVSNRFGVRESVIKSRAKFKEIAIARKYACYLMRKHCRYLSLKEISIQSGYNSNGSHATVLYHYNDMEDAQKIYKDVKLEVLFLEKQIENYISNIMGVGGYTVKDAIDNPEILKDYI